MFRFKTLLGGHLSLRDYDAQVGEAMAMVKALNRITLYRNAEQYSHHVTIDPMGHSRYKF